MVARNWGTQGETGLPANGDRASLWSDINALELDSGDGFMTVTTKRKKLNFYFKSEF